MSLLATGGKLGTHALEHRLLRIDEALQPEGIAHRAQRAVCAQLLRLNTITKRSVLPTIGPL